MAAGSAFITWMSVPYFDFGTLPAFVIEKLPLRFEALWLASLRVHVAAAVLGFPLCLVLMTRTLQRRKTWHRWLGRAAGIVVLFVLVPSGIVLSFDAKGGFFVTIGFMLSAAIIAGAMIRGVRAARRHDLAAHAHAMRHVLGQMSVAVISRAMIVGFDVAGVDPGVAYIAALWIPVLAIAGAVELGAQRPKSPKKRLESSERKNHEVSVSVLVVPHRAVVRPFARVGR